MSVKILMPALSPTMTEGVLQKWLVKIGDQVKAGDVIAEIETDKATMELETVDEGKITSLLVTEGSEGVAVNTPIAILNGSENEKIDNTKKDEPKNQNNQENQEKEKIFEKTEPKKNIKNFDKNKTNNKFASPYSKKFARDNNIDLTNIQGSGPNGRIIKRDLKLDKFISSTEYKSIEPSSMRKIIAERTTATKNSVPHFYLTIESNVDKLLKLRKNINDQYNDKVSINDILVKALAIAQKNNPKTNVSWHNGKIIQYSSVDISIAVALDEGLITPIIKNADIKGLLEISQDSKTLIKKAKEGKLKPDDYNGGTISISNLGMYGINEFSAIINPPQSSILAVGAIQKIPKVINDDIKIINIMKSTLSADHRVLDGAIAAQMLKEFNDIIENPFDLWLQSKDMEII